MLHAVTKSSFLQKSSRFLGAKAEPTLEPTDGVTGKSPK
jgi:hypothetical protein